MDEGDSSTRKTVQALATYFDLSDEGFAWRGPRPEQIRERRAAMDDKLIFDILLISGGIRDPDFIYPPHDVAGLNRLLDAIDTSNYDILKKQTLIYFLLKWHQDGREDFFKVDCCIPPQFSALADAYWHLDSGINIGRAISILSDSRLNRDYASKIIQAITLSEEPGPLLRKYVRTAKPSLVEPPDLLRYLVALAESSFVEAWHFQRTFADTDELRPRLFRQLLDWAIHPHPQPKALKDLISLPLSKFEEGLLNEYALKPSEEFSTASIAQLQDLVCVRYIELGRYADAIKMDRKFSSSAYDGKESSERRNMIHELYEALPPVEKSLIDMPAQAEKPKHSHTPSNGDLSMSQSWEEVRVPESLNKSTSTPLRSIQIPTTTSLSANTPPFTVATATTDLSASTGTAPAPPPILPLSTSAVASQSAFTPRKGLTTSNLLSSSLLGSTKGRPPLSGVGQRMAAGNSSAVSSPASGVRFPLHSKPPVQSAHTSGSASGAAAAAKPPPPPAAALAATPTQPVFKSTTNQANAFYQPKPKQLKRAFAQVVELEDSAEPAPNVSSDSPEPEPEPEATEQADQEKSRGDDSEKEEDHVPGWQNSDEVSVPLDQSIFAPSERISRSRVVPPSTSASHGKRNGASFQPKESISASVSAKGKSRKQPPGAFGDDDEGMDEDDDDHRSQSEEEVAPPPQTRRRSVQPRPTSTSANARQTKGPIAKRGRTTAAGSRKSKANEDLGRSIPGGLMVEDDHDGHDLTAGEEEDHIAPLRAPSPIATAKRPVRKARSVASASDFGDDDGVKTRRRSSRLTATGSVRNLSPESVQGDVVSATKPKKSRASTAGRKRK